MTSLTPTAAPGAAPEAATPPHPSAVATLVVHPPPGEWTVAMWASLATRETPCELVEGSLELLPLPNVRHHLITAVVAALLRSRLQRSPVFENGLKVRLSERTGRIPDVVVLDRPLSDDELEAEFVSAERVVLAVEVVSPGRRQRDRDFRDKREDYAAAGIAEYWIVDPESRTVLPLVLADGTYPAVEPVPVGGSFTTPLLAEPIDVAAIFA